MLQGLLEMLRRLVWPLIAVGILVGILIGLILGWQVWPVRWYDTDPSDLREQHKMSYVIMAADSLAVTGNQELAKRRLADLVDKRNTWEQVANLVERVALEREQAGDSAAALRVRRLAQVVQLPSPKVTPATPAAKPSTRSTRLLIFLLALGAFLVALAILLWFLAQKSKARLAMQVVTASAEETRPASPGESRWSFMRSKPVPAEEPQRLTAELAEEPLGEELEYEEEEYEEEPEPQQPPFKSRVVPVAPTERPVPPQPHLEEPEAEQPLVEEVPTRAPGEPPPAMRKPGATPSTFAPLGTFDVGYNLGDDDFDCSFSIESPSGDFLGECGVGICDVLRVDAAQQVDAFEIWLFDKGDIRTVSKILVSERAYQDEALKARLSGKGELVQAQSGLTIILQTLSLRVTATLKAFEYTQDEQAPDSVFAHLQIELLAELNESPS